MVDDEAHVGFVDAHAEGNGGNDDVYFFHEEFVLVFGTDFVVQTGVVGEGFDAVELKEFGEVFNFFSGKAVNDAAFALVLAHKFDYFFVQFDGFGGLWADFVVQVRTVE